MSFDFSDKYEPAPECKREVVKKDISFLNGQFSFENDLSDASAIFEKGTFIKKTILKFHKKVKKPSIKNNDLQTPKKVQSIHKNYESKINSQIATPQNDHYQESTADNSIDDFPRNSALRSLNSNLNSPAERYYLSPSKIQIKP